MPANFAHGGVVAVHNNHFDLLFTGMNIKNISLYIDNGPITSFEKLNRIVQFFGKQKVTTFFAKLRVAQAVYRSIFVRSFLEYTSSHHGGLHRGTCNNDFASRQACILV